MNSHSLLVTFLIFFNSLRTREFFFQILSLFSIAIEVNMFGAVMLPQFSYGGFDLWTVFVSLVTYILSLQVFSVFGAGELTVTD